MASLMVIVSWLQPTGSRALEFQGVTSPSNSAIGTIILYILQKYVFCTSLVWFMVYYPHLTTNFRLCRKSQCKYNSLGFPTGRHDVDVTMTPGFL